MSKDCVYWYNSNSHKGIPEDVYTLHEVHCMRFLSVCSLCKEVIPKSKKSSHDAEFHAKEPCNYCMVNFEAKDLSLHKTVCNARPKPCLYCGAVMELFHLINHEDTCGNRTEDCELCGKIVIIKNIPEHLAACVQTENQDPQPLKRKKNSNPAKKKSKRKFNE